MTILQAVLQLLKFAGLIIAIAIAIYNFIMFLAISTEDDGNVEEFAKHIGVPSLIVAGILILLCR